MPPEREVFLQILNGLDHIHSKGFVHRDIKPENILIIESSPKCSVKLADFGLSKRTTSGGDYSLSGPHRGTKKWMAPECLRLINENQQNPTAMQLPRGSIKSDIFSAGCVLFYYATQGVHPFGTSLYITENIIHGKPINFEKLGWKSSLYNLLNEILISLFFPSSKSLWLRDHRWHDSK